MTTDAMYLGHQPETLKVLLIKGSDFVTTLELNQPWPAGTTLTLTVGTATWTATISGVNATFSVDKAVANEVDDKADAKLTYTNGTTDQVWAIGKVVRRDG